MLGGLTGLCGKALHPGNDLLCVVYGLGILLFWAVFPYFSRLSMIMPLPPILMQHW